MRNILERGNVDAYAILNREMQRIKREVNVWNVARRYLVALLILLVSGCAANLTLGVNTSVSAAAVESSEIGSYSISGSAQSFAYDSDKNRIVVFSPSGQAVIIDASTFKKTGTASFTGGGHCNGATYNPVHKVFAVAPTSAYYSGGYYIYDTNVKKLGTIQANPGGAIAYSKNAGAYYAGGAGHFKTVKCSSATGKCDVSNWFALSLSGNNQQDADTYGKYFYQCTISNTIHKIDFTAHKKIETYSIGGSELESILFIGESAYTLHHHSGGGSFSIRKISDSDTKKMLSGAGENNSTTSGNSGSNGMQPNRTVAGTTKPKDISEYKKAMKASTKKKLKKKKPQALKTVVTAPCTSILPENWCKSATAVYELLNLFIYVITAGVGVLGMAGIIWMGVVYMTAQDNAERTRMAKKRILEIAVAMLLWSTFYALTRWFLMGKI